uniref:Formin-like protein 1 n=1 Tax=Salarias fasciatus TaxID=181472 RepID=A0A672F9B9_SALFA
MNLPPDKLQLLSQYDNEKKWELICDQERFQVKSPPSTYLTKIKSFYQDQGGVSRRLKKRIQDATQVLKDLEISLRTNHIGWAQEFLNEQNKGLDVLVEYLSYAQSDSSVENGGTLSERGKPMERSMEDLSKSSGGSSSSSSQPHGMTRAARALTVRWGDPYASLRLMHRVKSHASYQRDDIHVCIMCLRAIMNYQSGFNLVMTHPRCVNEITLSLNSRNPRTKALVLELLAAVCLVRGGHDITLSAFDNFKEVSREKNRFEKLMEYFIHDDSNIDFMVACMQFINIVVHSVENMNFRVHLQYEFTHLGLDKYLENLKQTESEKLQVQIQAYLDNVLDVGALLEDAENRGGVLDHVDELQEHNIQLNARLQEMENQSAERITELETQLMQATKEAELLKVSGPSGNILRSIGLISQGSCRRRGWCGWAAPPPEAWTCRWCRSPWWNTSRVRRRRRLHLRSTPPPSKRLHLRLLRLPLVPQGRSGLLLHLPLHQDLLLEGLHHLLLLLHLALEPRLLLLLLYLVLDPHLLLLLLYLVLDPHLLLLLLLHLAVDPHLLLLHLALDPHLLLLHLAVDPHRPLEPRTFKLVRSLTENCDGIRDFLEFKHRKTFFLSSVKGKKTIQTKFRMPLLNWQALKPNQVTGTVFNELDDDQILEELNMDMFEEQFKTRAQGNAADLTKVKKKVQQAPSKTSLIDPNKAKNLAITLRKAGMKSSDICTAIEKYDQQSLSIDLLELLEHFIPSDFEMKLLKNYEKDGRPLDELTDEDQFILRFGKIPRLTHNSTQSLSWKWIVLAFGNYMNSSKRGAAYGFRLQSLDLLLETKSTDRSQTLLHFITNIIQEKYPDLTDFHTELRFVDKAGVVSLDGILQDIRLLERGMEVAKKENQVQDDSPVLEEFIRTNSEALESLIKDSKTAQEAYISVVEYFGENPKTTQPAMFFPMFGRFIKAYKKAQQDIEQKKKMESEVQEVKNSPSPNKAASQKVREMNPAAVLMGEKRKMRIKLSPSRLLPDLRNSPYRRADGRRPAQRQDT